MNNKTTGWALILVGSITLVVFSYIGWSSRDDRIAGWIAQSRLEIEQGEPPEDLPCACGCQYYDQSLCLKPWGKYSDGSFTCTDDREELVWPKIGHRRLLSDVSCEPYEGYACSGFSRKSAELGKDLLLYGYYWNCQRQ